MERVQGIGYGKNKKTDEAQPNHRRQEHLQPGKYEKIRLPLHKHRQAGCGLDGCCNLRERMLYK